MRFLLLLYALTLCTGSAIAQASDSSSLSLEQTLKNQSGNKSTTPQELAKKNGYAEEQIDVRKFDEKKWKEIVGGKDYSEDSGRKKKQKKGRQFYDSTRSGSNSSAGKRFDDESDNDEYEDEPDNSSSLSIPPIILKIIFYTITFGIIGYILFLIIKNTSLKSKGKIQKTELADVTAHVTDIKELEIDPLLREALASGDYRLAIRIYFLGLLKKLDEDGSIVWKKDKTNRDYLAELFAKELYFEEVKTLTLAYEQVWYGDHSFSTQTYERIISSFQAINDKLSTANTE